MMSKKRTRCGSILIALSFVSLLSFCFALIGSAAEEPGKPPVEKAGGSKKVQALKSDSPLHISSDRLEVDQQKKIITFEGHVTVRQEDMTITGARMIVYATGEEKGGEKNKGGAANADAGMMKKIDHIEILGDVKITQRDKLAVADKAVYYHREQKVVLLGNPSVSQGRDKVAGRLITLFLEDGRSVVEGGESTPVQAILHPKKD